MRICGNCKAVCIEAYIPRSRSEDFKNGTYSPDYKWGCHLGYEVHKFLSVRFCFGWCPHPKSYIQLHREMRKRGLSMFDKYHEPIRGIKYHIKDD